VLSDDVVVVLGYLISVIPNVIIVFLSDVVAVVASDVVVAVQSDLAGVVLSGEEQSLLLMFIPTVLPDIVFVVHNVLLWLLK